MSWLQKGSRPSLVSVSRKIIKSLFTTSEIRVSFAPPNSRTKRTTLKSHDPIEYSSDVAKDDVITGSIDYYALSASNAGSPFRSLSQGGTALTGDALTATVSQITGELKSGTEISCILLP